MGVVILYSTFGGAWAVIQTDMLQFVFLGVFLPLALIIGVPKAGGAGEMVANMPGRAHQLPRRLDLDRVHQCVRRVPAR